MRVPPKLFITGATGYIGGDALHVIIAAHPDWSYTSLVRDSEKGAAVAARYPKVRLVYGDLDSTSLIEEEARVADVVLHFANADHEPAAHAIATGISSRASDQPPGHWIHTSGTGILLYPDLEISSFGHASTKIWDDVADVRALTTAIPDFAPHRSVDKIVLDAAKASPEKLKTAIVCPPTIYGVGRGVGNTRSIQVPELARCFLERKQGFVVGAGETLWTHVHVRDLSDLYLRLVEEAVKPGGGKATWGAEGYYFTENGEHVWGDISRKMAAHAHKLGFTTTAEAPSLDTETVNRLCGRPFGAALWGCNARCRATRARKELGWKPESSGRPTLEDSLNEALNVEAKRLGILKGHAAEAAGD